MQDYVLSPIEIGKLANSIADILQSRQPTTATAPDPADDLITPKQACELLQCTSVTLWRWEKKGRVTPYGIGGKKFFKRSQLLQSIVKK